MDVSTHRQAFVISCLIILLNAAYSTADDICIGREEFEQRFAHFEQELQQLRADNAALQRKVGAIEADKTSQLAGSSLQDETVLSQHTDKRYLVNDEIQGAAFSVTISVDGLDNLGVNQTIHFDKVVSNYGNHFDTRLNAFTAPVPGWYVFSLTLMARPQHLQYLYVVKNGQMVFHVYSQGTDYATDSKTMVVHMDQGDEVWVQTSENSAFSHVINGSEHTSFTGFLLYVD